VEVLARSLTCEYPGDEQMPRITRLLSVCDIAKDELVETCMTRNIRIDGREGEKDSPGYEPGWYRDADHHAQETDKKVAVQSVDLFDILIIGIEKGRDPSQEAGR